MQRPRIQTPVIAPDLVVPIMAALTLAGRAATARVALAYPLHHKGRSSLALSMFALVSFTPP